MSDRYKSKPKHFTVLKMSASFYLILCALCCPNAQIVIKSSLLNICLHLHIWQKQIQDVQCIQCTSAISCVVICNYKHSYPFQNLIIL